MNSDLFSNSRFCFDSPNLINSFKIQSNSWKFKFEEMNISQIYDFLLKVDGRPRLTASIFENFNNMSIVEFGPSDGYNTAQLEINGATKILSIEANIDSFYRCLIIKNAFNLKSQFLLGDFNKYLDEVNEMQDLAYASGVLYHLSDPLNFLFKLTKKFNNIFLWTMYFDSDAIASDSYESKRFIDQSEVNFDGVNFLYHTRSTDPDFIKSKKYQGGIVPHSNWLSLKDIRIAFDLAGFKILKEIPDNVGKIPAMNFWASRI